MSICSNNFSLPAEASHTYKMKNIDVGFDTIGNATMICYDREPVLATDPWVQGSAYFGSWGLSHEIPEEQMKAIKDCKYIWYSHGHPDHLNWDSIDLFREKTILLPDHYGKRIFDGLQQAGYQVKVLADKKWYPLSDKIKVMCFSDIYQDAVLLIDINGTLAVNANDANRLLLWSKSARRVIRSYDRSFLLSLTGHGDAEMINFRDENGKLINPPELMQKNPLSALIFDNIDFFGVKAFIPFSSLHRYQRSDSIWAQEASVTLEEYAEARLEDAKKVFPPFIRYNCVTHDYEEISPKANEGIIYEPAHFGDSWEERLEKNDVEAIRKYFKAVDGLKDYWDFINVRIGGEEHTIELADKKFNVGITFEAPKQSFMFSVNNNIFEDMFIGNYMKVTWHGKAPDTRLYPDTLPLVKFADNGLAYTKDEVDRYLEEYSRRYPFDFMMESFQRKCASVIRSVVTDNSPLFTLAQKVQKRIF